MPSGIVRLPPLGALPVFEAAGRLESFKKAAAELNVTPAAIAHRVKTLEQFLALPLFERHPRGIRLNRQGKVYLSDIQPILANIVRVTEHHRPRKRNNAIKLVIVESLAQNWLMPRLPEFKANHPEIAIGLETDLREFDLDRYEFDVWITFTEETEAAPWVETLFDEALVPVGSPAFLEAHGRPEKPQDLLSLPLLYDLAWEEYWSLWFANHGTPVPDLSRAWGFRLHSMMIRSAIDGMGIALGHARLIAPELKSGKLIKLFDSNVPAPARYVLGLPPNSQTRPEVQAFRSWVLDVADRTRDDVPEARFAPKSQ